MGASQSKSDSDEQVFRVETPIQFSEDVVNELVDHSASPAPSPARQSSIDAQIRGRIQAELAHLREEEAQVRAEIERALEKENLDRERAMAGAADGADGAGAAGGVKSSAALMGDLEELRQKVERFQTRRALSEFPEVQAKTEAVVNCYKSHPTTTLDCFREVNEFKNSVAKVEQHYIDSLRA
ncbi:MICOS complex subunit mic19 [Phanerochaete sordida]|uniref:MICOS complex subunit mic19 n=1 Tax=Phanerochaete sordida TaxID=48140 RepID=A0A9P3LJW4_9APHY|nr:MICOS complex subunit mic19 [Phanerochaete sordida]